MKVEYVSVVKLRRSTSHFVCCSFFVAPAGDVVLAVLGEDRILYTSLDTPLGKDYASRVLREEAWNVEKIKMWKIGSSACYTVPQGFARVLGLSKGDQVLVIGYDGVLEVIPLRVVLERVGGFREAILRGL